MRQSNPEPAQLDPIVIDVDKIDSEVLRRLIKEVRYQDKGSPHYYNRIHNRHNRS